VSGTGSATSPGGAGAPRDRLSARPSALVGAGVLARRPYSSAPPRSGYHLTEGRRDLLPVLQGLLQWGNTWLAGDPPERYRPTDPACRSTTTESNATSAWPRSKRRYPVPAHLTSAQDFAAMRFYLSTTAAHGRRPFDVLTELASGTRLSWGSVGWKFSSASRVSAATGLDGVRRRRHPDAQGGPLVPASAHRRGRGQTGSAMRS
jgi:HxlR-like helix-turn-helix